jgi:hypothetical protein
MLKVSPLSYQQKKKTSRLVQKMPNWLLANWAGSLNIDYAGGCSTYPDIENRQGKELAQAFLEQHDAVAVGNCIEDLGQSVVKHAQKEDLPIDSQMVIRHVCALALSNCTEDGLEFLEQVSIILCDKEDSNHPIVEYHLALTRGDVAKLEKLDDILAGGRYSEWVNTRIDEVKRYLGVDSPIVRLNFVERTPQWDALWESIVKGGDTD